MKKLFMVGIFAAALSSQAIVLDDFEHNNAGLYTHMGPAGNIIAPSAGAAFSGNFGGMFGGTPAAAAFRQDIMTSPGNLYTAMVRTNDVPTAGGRVYLGVGGSAGGYYSAVFAPNTGQLLIQDNTGFAFVTVQTAAAAITQGTWYQLHMNWAANGDMQASLYDQTGTSLVAQTGVWASGITTPGWLGFRGFTAGGAGTMIDDVMQAVPEPSTVIFIAIGLVALAARRLKA